MFEAIRSRLVGAWKDLHARGLPGLFVFELVVVTLGVLLAQAIADWAGRRAAMDEMETVKAELDSDMAIAADEAYGWTIAAPCIAERMGVVMRLLGEGGPVDPELIFRPGMQNVALASPDTETEALMVRRYGRKITDEYGRGARLVQRMGDRIDSAATHWEALGLVDPRNGPVSVADRTEARRAAASIRASMATLADQAQLLMDMAKTAGIEPAIDAPHGARPARSCEEIWASGKTHPVPDFSLEAG